MVEDSPLGPCPGKEATGPSRCRRSVKVSSESSLVFLVITLTPSYSRFPPPTPHPTPHTPHPTPRAHIPHPTPHRQVLHPVKQPSVMLLVFPHVPSHAVASAYSSTYPSGVLHQDSSSSRCTARLQSPNVSLPICIMLNIQIMYFMYFM